VNQLSEHYLEDFAVGQTFSSGRLRIEKERIFAFAAEFDPQPFHLDEAAARNSIFGGLCASGWHTLAVTMRLLLDSELKPAGGFIGAGLDECRWPRRRVARRVSGPRRATIEVASVAGPDQASNDYLESGWRGRAGVCREPPRAAPEGHSAGLTTAGKSPAKVEVIAVPNDTQCPGAT